VAVFRTGPAPSACKCYKAYKAYLASNNTYNTSDVDRAGGLAAAWYGWWPLCITLVWWPLCITLLWALWTSFPSKVSLSPLSLSLSLSPSLGLSLCLVRTCTNPQNSKSSSFLLPPSPPSAVALGSSSFTALALNKLSSSSSLPPFLLPHPLSG